MKIKIIILAFVFTAFVVAARMVSLFSNWEEIEGRSRDIVVVNCGKPVVTKLPPNTIASGAAKSDFEAEIIYVLKGTNSLGMARLQTDHELRQGENYLVFGNFDQGICTSYEKYKVVPIGDKFPTNSVMGKPMEEQVKILFQRAVFKLNREIENDREQKQQLETLVGQLK